MNDLETRRERIKQDQNHWDKLLNQLDENIKKGKAMLSESAEIRQKLSSLASDDSEQKNINL